MKKKDIYKAFSILATMFTILGINLFDIPLIIFFIILCICIVIIIIELNKINNKTKEAKRYNSKKSIEQLLDAAQKTQTSDEQCNILADALILDFNKIETTNSNMCKKYYKNIRITVFVMVVIIIGNCIKNREEMMVYANMIFATIERITSTELAEEPATELAEEPATELAEEPTTELAEEPATELAEEPADISINTWTEFKLEYPEGYPWIDDNEYNNLYREIFYSEDVNGLNEIIKSKIVVWLNSCTPNTPLDNAVTSDEKSITYFLEIESNFSNKGDVILSSDLLDEVIMGRKELLELYPNGTSAWILANHMQTYALNYLYQSYPTKDEKSIMYLYMKAINYTQKSLEFEMDIAKKCERISYIQSRYKDIAECKIVNTDIRLRAYEIYTNIQEELNELQIS